MMSLMPSAASTVVLVFVISSSFNPVKVESALAIAVTPLGPR